MKKQILFIVFFLAAFANLRSYAQCVAADPLHPIAGVEYTYSVGILPATLTNVTFDWFITTSSNIISATVVAEGTGSTFAATGSPYNSSTAGTSTIKITWTPALIAAALGGAKYYIVVKYTGTTAAACNASNIKAYKVIPINLFQLDLVNVNDGGTAESDGYSVCPSDITSGALTDNGTNATIVYDYGVNDLYVKVTVRNFTGDWKMTVNRSELAGLAGTGEVFALAWGTTIAGATNAIGDDNAVTIDEQTSADATDGEVIYLKLTYAHHTFEGLTAKAVSIKVNATDIAGNPDVSSTCTAETDQVTQNITIRPEVTSTTTASPNNFIMP